MMRSKKTSDEVIFCFDCKTDLRIQNERYHKDVGHDVRRLVKDPRDIRPKQPASPSTNKILVFGLDKSKATNA